MSILSLSLLVVFVVVSLRAQNIQLRDAKTMEDVFAYVNQEVNKAPPDSYRKESFLMPAGVFMSAGEKLLEIAKNDVERRNAHALKLQSYQCQVLAGVEGAEKELETFLDKMATSEHASLRNLATLYRFGVFCDKAMGYRGTRVSLDQSNSELKQWLNHKDISISDILSALVSLGEDMLQQYGVRGEKVIDELIGFVQSPACTLTAEDKAKVSSSLESIIRLEVGRDPKLYGKTLDNRKTQDDKDFQWKDLRGKYVLIEFTSTWCPTCKEELPAMREAYKKYRDKGFEIVSVYIWGRGTESEQISNVKKIVKEETSWITISETRTVKSKQPPQGDFYNISYVPTMVLVDKEGKIIAKNVRCVDGSLQAKLEKLFK
ncbi:MAG: TlpA family protein disulfide reductase [Planctomycetaceae bacterium]|nr:TlpA family protein disulfide reductase [Planctomycetaceae bacterium]